MAELCSCDISIMTQDQARPGWLTCSACGGAWFNRELSPYKLDFESATRIGEFIAGGGAVAGVWHLREVVFVPPQAVVAPPGKARLGRCPDCDFAARNSRPCDCGGTGILVHHACVNCGDTTMWVYGTTGREGDWAHMSCRLCGTQWDQAHPEWIAQRVPERVAPTAAVG
jgi:hypothetical protein